MEWNSIMDFLDETIKEQKLLDTSFNQSKQNKVDRQTKQYNDYDSFNAHWSNSYRTESEYRYLESFSDDLRTTIIKKVKSKNMIRPYTPEEEEILRKGLKENNNG